jgi:hypothetical protein
MDWRLCLADALNTKTGKEFLSECGLSPSDIGTHSIRKGASTYVCSGCTGGPSIVSVCLRCGWSLGGVQDRYLRYESAGDQFVGRVVCGLPLDSCEFAILPPHANSGSFGID